VVPAPRPFLPWDVVMHAALPPKSHTCDSEGRTASLARGNFRWFSASTLIRCNRPQAGARVQPFRGRNSVVSRDDHYRQVA
jgi:hypothetical protein